MPALIFGTDEIPSAAPFSLPTATEGYFAEGGAGISGTQVPAYWFDKVGAELSNAIKSGGATINMAAENQLAILLETLYASILSADSQIAGLRTALASLFSVPPYEAHSGQGTPFMPGFSDTLRTPSFTPPYNGKCSVQAYLNVNGIITQGGITTTLSSSISGGETSSDGTSESQFHEIVVPVTAGVPVSFSFAVAASGVSSTTYPEATYGIKYSYQPQFS